MSCNLLVSIIHTAHVVATIVAWCATLELVVAPSCLGPKAFAAAADSARCCLYAQPICVYLAHESRCACDWVFREPLERGQQHYDAETKSTAWEVKDRFHLSAPQMRHSKMKGPLSYLNLVLNVRRENICVVRYSNPMQVHQQGGLPIIMRA